MNFMTFTVYLLLVLPLPLTLATGAVSFVSLFDVSYYERHCQHYFSIDCPVHDHDSWLCSKIITNCTSPDYPYHCILNTAGKVVHVCAAAQICLKGTVPIFDPRTRMVSCQNCQKGYFQPYQIWSNNTPVCMEKFGCDINKNQIECTVEPEKEQTQNTLCRCDARNDYILSNSEGREICVPGKFADCYYIFRCPDGQERLLNYSCAPRCEEGFQRDDSDICVPKSTVITTTEGDKATPTSTASTENFSKRSISGNNVIIVTDKATPTSTASTENFSKRSISGNNVIIVTDKATPTSTASTENFSKRSISGNNVIIVTDKATPTSTASTENFSKRSISGNNVIIVTDKATPTSTASTENFSKRSISGNNVIIVTDKAMPTSTDSTENISKESISENLAIIVTVVISVFVAIILIISIVLFWKVICSRQFSPVPTDDNVIEISPMNNAQTDDPELGTLSNDTTGNATSRERPNQAEIDDPELGTLSNDTTGNATSRDRPIQAQTDDSELGTLSNEKLHRTVLNRCLQVLIQDLDFSTVMIHIQQKEIFRDVTIRDIKEQATTTEKISMLIEKLKQKPQDRYEEFKECLVLAGQEDLKNMLEEVEERITKEIGETH